MKTQKMPGCVINEWDDRYSSVTGTITASGADLDLGAGEILNLVSAGVYFPQADDLGSTGGVLKHPVKVLDGATATVAVLVKGPSLVNAGALNTGGTLATSIGDLETLGIGVVPVPTKVEP